TALYGAADAAYAALVARPGVDPGRIYVYGRSLGTAAATWVAARHPVAGLILESPFTSAAAMARQLYALLPRFIVRLSLDNVGRMQQIRSPVLVFHGDADRLVPTAMGRAVAAAASGPVQLVLIHGAGHNETDRKSTRLNSSHSQISYAVFCLKKKIDQPGRNGLARADFFTNPFTFMQRMMDEMDRVFSRFCGLAPTSMFDLSRAYVWAPAIEN